MELNKNNIPKLVLVGAGPGDPDLITVKGLKAIAKADVILYDALVDSNLIGHCKKDAVKIFVGKRGGKNYIKQEEINELIVQQAFLHGTVVRLKGGDPFVFGRGHEEMDYAQSFGLQTEYIPGLSSSIAVPGSQGIPVTKRGKSESFWVITATTKSGELSEDLKLAAQSDATVIVLMGMRKLPEIVQMYQSINKGDIPVGVIQNGTTLNEIYGIGTADTIEQVVIDNKLASPAVIVIGEVVNEHPSMIKKMIAEATQ